MLTLGLNLGKLKGQLLLACHRRFCIPWFFNVKLVVLVLLLYITAVILGYRKRFLGCILILIQNDECFRLVLSTWIIHLLMYETACMCLVQRLLISSWTNRVDKMQSVGPHASTGRISHLLQLLYSRPCMSTIIILAVNRHFAHNWQLIHLLRSNVIIVHHSVAIYFDSRLVTELGTTGDVSHVWRFLIICDSLLGHLVDQLSAAFRQILALRSLVAMLPRHHVLIFFLHEVVALLVCADNFCVARILI